MVTSSLFILLLLQMRIGKVMMYLRVLYCDYVLGSIFPFPNNLTFVSQCCSVGQVPNLAHIGSAIGK